MWYQNHIEAVLCVEGESELTNEETGEKHWITPGTMCLPRRARAAHAAPEDRLPLHLRVQPAGHRTGGPRRERASTRSSPTRRRPGDGAARAKAVFRTPTPEDGLKVWELVEDTPGLDTNSPYAYVLWFRDFADCSLVATVDDEIVGFPHRLPPPRGTGDLLRVADRRQPAARHPPSSA